eukprot:125663-Prorocentrum_lima.AAC.1
MVLVRDTVRAPFLPCPPLPLSVASKSFGKAIKSFHARVWAATVVLAAKRASKFWSVSCSAW